MALMEWWEGNGAVSGRSLNAWDPGRGAWHQTWMDSSGSTLLSAGGLGAVADLNGDGAADLMSGSPFGEFAVHLNAG